MLILFTHMLCSAVCVVWLTCTNTALLALQPSYASAPANNRVLAAGTEPTVIVHTSMLLFIGFLHCSLGLISW